MANAIAIDEAAIAEMTEDAINAIALIVQTKIGQTDGGIAGVHFSGDDEREAVADIIRRYLAIEEIYSDREEGRCNNFQSDGRGCCINCGHFHGKAEG